MAAGTIEKPDNLMEITSKINELNFTLREPDADIYKSEICDDDCSGSVISYDSDWSYDDSEYEHGPTVKLTNDYKDMWRYDEEKYGNLIYEHSHPTLDEKWLRSEEDWEKLFDAFEIVQIMRLKYKYDVLIRKISQARCAIRIEEIKIPIGYKSSQILEELWEEDVLHNPHSPYLFQIFIK